MVTLHQKDSLPGKVLESRYAISELLGSGSVCDVYLATQIPMFRRKVAVRVLKKSICSAGDAEALVHRKHFMLEAELATRLKAPCFARILDSGVYRDDNVDRPYVVMEFVEGQTAWEWARSTQVSLGSALRAVLEVGEGLEELGRLSLSYRDLNPANVKWEPGVTVEPRARLFDVSHVLPARESGTVGLAERLLLGVPPFAPPEQAQGLSGPAGDVWSAGSLLYFLLEGRPHLDVGAQRWDEFLQKAQLEPQFSLTRITAQEARLATPLLEGVLRFDPSRRIPLGTFLDQVAETLVNSKEAKKEGGLRGAISRLLR